MNCRKNRNKLCLFLVFCCVLFWGCTSGPDDFIGQYSLSTSTETSAVGFLSSDMTVTPDSMKTPVIDASQNKLVFRDSQRILLNVTSTVVDLGICYPLGSTEVWEANYPFLDKQVLLASDELKNYFAPTYSPDGQWIAYIESSPVVTIMALENSTTPNPPGNDSIWIMRHDGTEKQQVSKSLNSFSLKDSHYCYPQSRINPTLIWSPDGKFIYFSDYQIYSTGDYRIDYYILNVQTKDTIMFNSGPWNTLYDFAWVNESGQFLFEDDGKHWTNHVTENVINRSEDELSFLNSTIEGGDEYYRFTSVLNDPILISHNDSTNHWVLMKYSNVQKIWTNKIEYTGQNHPRFGTYWGVYIEDEEIFFIDLQNWKFVNPVHNARADYFQYYFPEVIDETSNPIVCFLDVTTNDIWCFDPNRSTKMVQMVEWNFLDPEKKYSVIDQYSSWSWSP